MCNPVHTSLASSLALSPLHPIPRFPYFPSHFSVLPCYRTSNQRRTFAKDSRQSAKFAGFVPPVLLFNLLFVLHFLPITDLSLLSYSFVFTLSRSCRSTWIKLLLFVRESKSNSLSLVVLLFFTPLVSCIVQSDQVVGASHYYPPVRRISCRHCCHILHSSELYSSHLGYELNWFFFLCFLHHASLSQEPRSSSKKVIVE
jgi:hypothetical protein